MRIPDSLALLLDYGIIQEVVRPLMSGKEAQVYLVRSEGEERVAKVYKEAQARTFKHRSEYTEGRKTRNSRDQRAIQKRTRHGRKQDEAAWRSTEVDMIYRLRDAGVRVPEPYEFAEGVLIMELVKDADGDPAPRLGDLSFDPREAQAVYDRLIAEVVKMLCAGAVHGDLSEFNVLMGADGPVVIDFPQAVDPAGNQNARRLLLRDVDNLHRFLARSAPGARRPRYAEEMWELYQVNKLAPTTALGGNYKAPERKADTRDVLDLIADADAEERMRRGDRGEEEVDPPPTPFRRVVDLSQDAAAGRRSGSGPRRGAKANGAAKADRPRPAGGEARPGRPRPKGGEGAAAGASRSRRGGRRSAGPKEERVEARDEARPPRTKEGSPERRRRRSRRPRARAEEPGSNASGGEARPAKRRPARSGEEARSSGDPRSGASSKPRAEGAKKRPRRRRRSPRPRSDD